MFTKVTLLILLRLTVRLKAYMFHWFWGGLNYPVLCVLEVDAATEEQVVKVEKTIRDSDSFVWGGCSAVIHIPSMYHGNPQPSFLGVITHILGV